MFVVFEFFLRICNVFDKKPFTLWNLTDPTCESFLYISSFLLTLITPPRMVNLCFGAFYLFFFLYMINNSSSFLYFEHFLLFRKYLTVLSQVFSLAFFVFSLSSSTHIWGSFIRFSDGWINLCTLNSFTLLTGTPYFTSSFNFHP